MPVLDQPIAMLDAAAALELRGTVREVQGLALRVSAMPAPVGSMVRVTPRRVRGKALFGQIVGCDGDEAIVLPFGSTDGVSRGDPVYNEQHEQQARVGVSLLGRVIDGLGKPIDGRGPLPETVPVPLQPKPVEALRRPPIDQPLATGLRAIDAITPLGKGQRIGIFAAPGVGKSTLMANAARHTAADVSVIAMVGERGREVRDFIEKTLGPEGLTRSVVVVATSDEPALMRLRAAMVATAAAESFRDQGLDVLLLMDSVTRLCQAQRQVGLAAGEPPTTRGYPPSVFAMLPALLERSGRTENGSITGLYTVLVEGDDMTEPVADACQGILDGHLHLSRKLAERGHYPAIDILSSISRCADDVTDSAHHTARREVLKLVSAYREVEDLLNIGAYAQGSNPDYDLAIACKPAIDRLLQQGRGETKGQADFNRTKAQLLALQQQISRAKAEQTSGKSPQTVRGPGV